MKDSTEIKVGKPRMFPVNVPVLLDFDEIYESDEDLGELATRIQLLKVGEYWLVITENIFDGELVTDYAAFISKEDALNFILVQGFEVEEVPVDLK